MAALAAGMVTFFVGLEAPRESAPDPVRGNAVAAFTGLCWGLTLLGLRWLEKGEGDGASAAAVLGTGRGSAAHALQRVPLAARVRAAA